LEPTEFDIILGRHERADVVQSPGNVWFRDTIEANFVRYGAISASCRKREKSAFISSLNQRIEEEGRRFFKKRKASDENPSQEEWYIVSEQEAHQKTGQALRDALLAKRKASNYCRSAAARREAECQEQTPQKVPDGEQDSCHSLLDIDKESIHLFGNGETEELDLFITARSVVSTDSDTGSIQDDDSFHYMLP
jgi:hypothetical protein